MRQDSVHLGALDIFDPLTEAVQSFEEALGAQAPFAAKDVYLPLIHDPENRLWLATSGGHLYLYDGTFRSVFQKPGVYFKCITIGEDGRIWLAYNEQLICINMQGEVLEEFELSGGIRGLWAAEDGRVWAATFEPEELQLHLWQVEEDGKVKPFYFYQNGQAIDLWDSNPLTKNYFFLQRTDKGFWYKAIDEDLHVLVLYEIMWYLEFWAE